MLVGQTSGNVTEPTGDLDNAERRRANCVNIAAHTLRAVYANRGQ